MATEKKGKNEKPVSLHPLSVEEALRRAMNVKPAKGNPGKLQAICGACGQTNMIDDKGGTEPAWVNVECRGCGKNRRFHINPLNDSDGGSLRNVYRTAVDKTG